MTQGNHVEPLLPELRLSHYPDYLDDPDGLERFRQRVVEVRDRHDMAPVNFNSLARLIDNPSHQESDRD